MSSDPIIEDIKSKLDIVDIIGQYVTLRQSGTNFKANCPFHNEKSPSFMVNRERQIYRCFGCGEAGDMFSFIQKQENIDFASALKILADKAGVILPEKQSRGGPAPAGSEKPVLYEINKTATQFFSQVLTSHTAGKEALAYVKKRGVNDASISRFQIGYAPSNTSPVQAVLTKRKFSPAAIRSAGSPDRFRDRIMFPFRDVIGQVVGFSGRALGEQMPKYLNTAETDLFRKNRFLYGLFEGKKAIGEAKKIILVEGQLDLVLAHQAGTPYTVATSGTALSEEHLRVLRRYSDTLHLALDGDAAGKKATERAIAMALSHEFEVAVVPIPEGSDPGELIATSPEVWHEALKKPIPAIEWLFSFYFPDARKPGPAEREKIYNALFPYIDMQKDSVSQSWAIQHLARLLGVTQEKAVWDALDEWKTKSGKQTPKAKAVVVPVVEEKPKSAEPALPEEAKRERSLVGLLIVEPPLLEYREFHLEEKDFTVPAYARLYKSIISWYNSSHTTKSSEHLIHQLEVSLPKASHQALQKLLFDAQTARAELESEQLLQEYTFLVQTIRQRLRKERIESFADLIAKAAADDDRSRVRELMQQMQDSLKQKEFHAKEDS